jgi:hypothetical protein
MSDPVSGRRRLLRWAGWFALANAGLVAGVGLRYLWIYATAGPASAWIYVGLAYAGHMSALAVVPLLAALVPAAALCPRARVVCTLGVVLASAGVSLLLLDSLVFAENRYHLDVLTFTLLAPETKAFLALYFVLALALEAMLAAWVWRRTERPSGRRIGPALALGLAACLLASQAIHAWADAHYDVRVTGFTRYPPLYFPFRKAGLLARLGLVDRNRAREQRALAALARASGGALNYPLAPLRCAPRPRLLNVLLVVVDGMRPDVVTPQIAPRLDAFARGAIRFDGHYSGGSASRAGMFSIFYSLPPTYFNAFAERGRPPVLMDLFRQHGYQFGVFASSPLYRLVDLDLTAFAGVPNLRRETSSGRGSSGRDRALTDEWHVWLGRRDPSRPFFGFLYYNAAVALAAPDDYRPALPTPSGDSVQARLHARYLRAVHWVDALLGEVLDDLERRRLLEQTVVLVTSDHGMEFDENGLGFTGHGTSYSHYQLRAALVLRWPGRAPARVTRRTSHNDLAPTLVGGLFGCTNPPSDYASGRDLFSDAQWDWLVATSYRDYALIEPDRVTIVLPGGYEIRDRHYRLVPNPTLSEDHLRAAMQEMRRFYR